MPMQAYRLTLSRTNDDMAIEIEYTLVLEHSVLIVYWTLDRLGNRKEQRMCLFAGAVARIIIDRPAV